MKPRVNNPAWVRAIQDVLDFPKHVLRRKHLYRIPKGWSGIRWP